jgi:hypothetical protein
MTDAPLDVVDRRIADADALGVLALRELQSGGATHVNLEATRPVSTLSALRELDERARREPLAKALAAWVQKLTLRRVLYADVARLERAWRADVLIDDALEPPRFSARFAFGRVLACAEPSLQGRWARALVAGARGSSEAARLLGERQVEAAQRLGLDGLDALLPCVAPAAVDRAAELVLSRTAALAPVGTSWEIALDGALAREADRGWPAHLSPAWAQGLVRGTGLTDGLALDLGLMPRPLGATSFARVLAKLGDAFARASAPRSAPFALAERPFDLRRARRAALFGSLVADPVFGHRALGLGRARARDQARQVARALVVTLRLDAARVLARGMYERAARDRQSLWESLTAQALGTPTPAALLGVVPRLSLDDGVRFMGMVLGMSDRRALIEHHDEDWFRSPHAAHALREEQATLPASPNATEEALVRGVEDLAGALEALEL